MTIWYLTLAALTLGGFQNPASAASQAAQKKTVRAGSAKPAPKAAPSAGVERQDEGAKEPGDGAKAAKASALEAFQAAISGKSAPKRNAGAAGAKASAAPANAEYKPEDITKYNAAEYYGKCMQKSCFKPENGLCQCRDANRFKAADSGCRYIAKALPYLEDEIVGDFQRKAANDCVSFIIAENNKAIDAEKSYYNTLAELTTCMKKECTSRSGSEFAGCFTPQEYAEKFPKCEAVYKDFPASKIEELNMDFAKSLDSYKEKYCEESFGTLRGGECYVKIGIGVSAKAIKKSQEFRVGDKIICSQTNFGTDLGGNDLEHRAAKKNLVVGSMRLAGTVLRTAAAGVNAAQAVQGGGWNLKLAAALSITGELGGVAQEAIGLHIQTLILGEPVPGFDGICFAMKEGQVKPVFYEDPETYYQLSWSEKNWADAGRVVGYQQ